MPCGTGKLQQALFELANALRHRFGSCRVCNRFGGSGQGQSGGAVGGRYFEKHTTLVKAYEEAMDEAYDERSAGAVALCGWCSGDQNAETRGLARHFRCGCSAFLPSGRWAALLAW